MGDHLVGAAVVVADLDVADVDSSRWLLPVGAYTSQEWFDLEQERLFERCWAFAGMEHELADDGDYLTVAVGRVPIVVVRTEHGLRAFHNLCRHRGAQLLEGRGNVGRSISCFYHRWRYGLDGRLTGVPQRDQFPGLCTDDLGLLPASVSTAAGMVFVHVDPAPPIPLDAWLGDIVTSLGSTDPSALHALPVERHDLRANWKLFVENHIDGYHLWHLHARSITGLDHRRQRWRASGRHWIFDEPATEPGTYPDRATTGLPLLPTTPPGGFGSVVMLAFPNLGIALGATFFATIHAIPLEPALTRIELRTHIAPMSTEDSLRLATREATAAVRQLVRRTPLRRLLPPGATRAGGGGADILAEDLRAAEAVQRAMASPSFSVGPMANDFERAITVFQRNVLGHVGAAGEAW
jgi:phenylpropionate dioxygenase-like ring-hydroxylating dioxygenase large terminal subunit